MRWIGAVWCCLRLLRSPPVTYYPQQAHVPVLGVSLVVCPRPPVTPFPPAAPYFLMDHTSVARSAHWIRMQVEARWLAQTATRPTRGVVTPTVTMTLLDQDGWRLRLERQRRGAALEAPTGKRGRPSSAPRRGQCPIPQSASLSHNSQTQVEKFFLKMNYHKIYQNWIFWSRSYSFLNFTSSISVIWLWDEWLSGSVLALRWAGDLSRAYPASCLKAAGYAPA